MKLTATWTINDDDLDDLMSFEQSAAAVEDIVRAEDDAVVWAVLKEQGWIQIKSPSGMRKMYQEMDQREWCYENCQGLWRYCFSGHFLFESEKDAAWFALRWV